MRYISTLEDKNIVIKDVIDNEVYNIEGLDIVELGYIMGKGFADEVFVIQEYLNGKSEFGNRTIEHEQETITATDKEGIVNTSHILEDSIIEVETNTIIVNNRAKCDLQFRHHLQSSQPSIVRLKIKSSIKELRISGYSRVTDVVICEKDLLRIGSLDIVGFDLGIEELNKNTPTKEVLTHITTDLTVRCERFSMLNLLNVPNVSKYSLFTDPYDIGEWFSKLCECDLSGRGGKPIYIHDKNKKIMEWFMSLENRKLKPTDISATTRETTLYKFEGTGIVKIELDIEEFDFANTVYLKTYKDMVVFVRVLRNTGTKQKYSYIANIHVHKKENIKRGT